MRRALCTIAPVSSSRSTISSERRSRAPDRVAQRTAGSSDPAPPLTTTLTASGSTSFDSVVELAVS